MDAGNHELVCWQTYIYEPRAWKYTSFQARYARLQFFTLRGSTLSRLITCLSSFQVGLLTQLCHWIGLNAFYKPWLKNLTCERTQILDKERCVKEQLYLELLYDTCIYFTSSLKVLFVCKLCAKFEVLKFARLITQYRDIISLANFRLSLRHILFKSWLCCCLLATLAS